MNKVLKQCISLLLVTVVIVLIVVHQLYSTRTSATKTLSDQYLQDDIMFTNKYSTDNLSSKLFSTEKPTLLTESTQPEGGHQIETAKQGFLLALQYSDQITGGTMNLLSLQCWGKSVTLPGEEHSVRVVEPFIQQGSRFGVSLVSEKRFETENSVQLRDLFDYLRWTAYAIDRDYTELISWNKFLESSPKQIIVAYSTCTDCDISSCLSENKLSSSQKMFLQRHEFEVVRTVCYRLGPLHRYEKNEFKDIIYGQFIPTNVSVIFHLWGGIIDKRHTIKRAILTGLPQCVRSKNDGLMTPSAKVVSDAKEYLKRYISGPKDSKTSGSAYIAVMFRMEYYAILLQRKSATKNSQYKSLLSCIDKINSKVNELKQAHQIQSVFLAMDYGKFGSFSFERLLKQEENDLIRLSRDEVDAATQKLYYKLFSNSSTLQDWEESFDRVASVNSSGYVAMMQKTLASRATCLVLIGGGSFQKTTQTMFSRYNNKSSCVYNLCGKYY